MLLSNIIDCRTPSNWHIRQSILWNKISLFFRLNIINHQKTHKSSKKKKGNEMYWCAIFRKSITRWRCWRIWLGVLNIIGFIRLFPEKFSQQFSANHQFHISSKMYIIQLLLISRNQLLTLEWISYITK